MTRLSKQSRRRAVSPRKRQSKYAMVHPAPAPYFPFKEHENVSGSSMMFIPKVK